MTTAGDGAARVGEVWPGERPRTDRAFAGLAPRIDARLRDALAAQRNGPVIDFAAAARVWAARSTGERR